MLRLGCGSVSPSPSPSWKANGPSLEQIVPEGHSQRTELHRLPYTVLETAVGAEENFDGKGLALQAQGLRLVLYHLAYKRQNPK